MDLLSFISGYDFTLTHSWMLEKFLNLLWSSFGGAKTLAHPKRHIFVQNSSLELSPHPSSNSTGRPFPTQLHH